MKLETVAPSCGWGNNELQWYTAGDNLYMQDGKMIIEARAESRGGKNYTSTRITTQNKKTFTFGRIDIRAKVPKGKGVWPAPWMLGVQYNNGKLAKMRRDGYSGITWTGA